MSGRLIITTKKSYCPWNAANVNRVLRDERLERERLQRQQQRENEADSSRRRHHQGEEGHVNLFPEAAEAEIRLAQGNTNNNNSGGGDVDQNNNVGILPVTLGGEESTNRKNGKVPFYLQTNNQSKGKYYDNSSYLGIRTRTTTTSDEITNSIMRDQFASREEYRKQKNDPMSRFYVDSAHHGGAAVDIYNGRDCPLRGGHDDLQSYYYYRSESHKELGNSLKDVKTNNDHGRNKSKKRKSRGGDDDRSETSSSSSSSSSSSTSSHDSRRRLKSRSRREERKRKRSKHSSSSNSRRRHRSTSHPERSSKSKKKRHKDKRTRRRKHRYKDCSE